MLIPLLVTTVVTATATAAPEAFTGNVCSLVAPTQLASVHVTVTKCTPHPTVNNSEGTIYDAVWGINKPTGGPRLNISILKPANAAMLQLMKSHAQKPDLANGKTAANAQFVVGDYIVTINLSTPTNKPLTSIAPFLALTNVVTGKLK